MQKISYFIITLLLVFGISACQPQAPVVLPTLARLASPTIITPPTSAPTHTATTTPAPTLTHTPPPSATITPTTNVTRVPSVTQTADATLTPTRTAQPADAGGVVLLATRVISPTAGVGADVPIRRTPLPQAFIFGQSAGGRDLLAYRYGTGDQVIMLVGGIHAGFEANTVQLVTELKDHFSRSPRDILPPITLIIVPSLNPDGLTYGRQLRGRFNGNNVDLNRNWGCGWSEEAFFREQTVNAGAQAFSEPETRALGSLIQRVQPRAVLFYHAAANGVFAGACDETRAADNSEQLATVYGIASGYSYGQGFSAYPITGSAPAWVASQGIASVDVELTSATASEFVRNLRGVIAVQQWLTQGS